MNRRHFIKGLGLTSCFSLIPSMLMANTQKNELFSETRLLMGTHVTLKAVHTSKDFVYESFAMAFAEMERVEAILTRHASSSALTLLNSQKKIKDAPYELFFVATEAQNVEKISQGAFNPSILPVLEYLENHKNYENKEIKKYTASIKNKSYRLENSKITLDNLDTKITFDGIAKGYIVDRAAETLEACGMQDFLINAGGDMRAKGMKDASIKNSSPWRVAIEDPEKQAQYPAVLPLFNAALATSGSYEKTFADNYNHLILPNFHTRLSTSIKSVSVLAKSAMKADAYATALSCMPVENALVLVNTMPEISCFIIDQSDKIYTSKNWV